MAPVTTDVELIYRGEHATDLNSEAKHPVQVNDQADEDCSKNLLRIADKIPTQVWFAMIVSTCERFTFYGLQSPFQNYLQNPGGDALRPGALGLGQSTATNISYLFSFLVYTLPLPTGILIDSYFGRYRGLVYFTGIYLIGAILLVLTAIPASIASGVALPGFFVSLIVIAIGLGGVKACMSPFMADQYTGFEDRVAVQKGKTVIISRDLTIGRIYHIYYWSINVGSLAGIATTFLEKEIGFWAAYLLPLCVLTFAAGVLVVCKDKFVKVPPGGNIMSSTFGAFVTAAKGGFNMDAARPGNMSHHTTWNDQFVTDLQRGLKACRVFAAYPILWLCHNQVMNNLISQAGQMRTYGLPNDIFMNINPIAVLCLLPVIQHVLYPNLRRMGINFPPINRMAVGFLIEACTMAYCTGVQQLIYQSGPCYDSPLKCPASENGKIPNEISVWVQSPIYIIDGLGEIFFDLASQQYAYTEAPESMKSVMQGILSMISGIGTALGFALYPATRDPYLVYMFASLASAMLVTTIVFWLMFRGHNVPDQMNSTKLSKTQEPPQSDNTA